MREIKFRVWDKKRKVILYSDSNIDEYIFITLNGTIQILDDDDEGKSGVWEHYDDETLDLELIQFTGLKDKNGVEIYEGDIVTLQFGTLIIYDIENPKIINWNESPAGWGISPDWANRMEVIGNIYENPELIK